MVSDNQESNKILALILFAISVLGIIFISFIYFGIVSKMMSLYKEFGQDYNSQLVVTVIFFYMATFVLQLFCGGLLLINPRFLNTQTLAKIGKISLFISAVLFFLFIPFIIISVILPIYNLTSTL